ncbi:MAG: Eco57I restriction-modification methylase domain-containing protein [Candidatus Lambdaproteobacteria bacterium]|nr:Eco57I restriction-modification methylase domain-containing protein [Candidatus Lambdaproteobacteria bacterium]
MIEAGRAITQALATCHGDRLGLARAFCHRLISAWWREFATSAGECPPLRPMLVRLDAPRLDATVETLADDMGAAAALMDIELAAYQIGSIYSALLPADHRERLGVYYTPPALTARLLDQATEAGVDWTRCTALDPACGGGAFLAPVARRMLGARRHRDAGRRVADVATRIRGFEIDPFAAWLSQVALDTVVWQACGGALRELPVLVTVCDSLRNPPEHSPFDLVIGNPPYGRVTLDAPDRERFRRSLYGHANLYGLFTDMALRQCRPGGVIAFVTPTSFVAGKYFKNLRALLDAEAPPASIDFVSARKGVFADVLQETLLATYRRGGRPAPASVHKVMPSNGGGLQIERVGTFTTLSVDASQPWLLARTIAQATLVDRLRSMPHRLADWGYTVSTGPLVWNRHKSQMREARGKHGLPIIWAEAVTRDGRFTWKAEKKNHKPYFEPNAGDEWLITRAPCVLLQRTTAKEQHRRLIATPLPAQFLKTHGAAVIENHINMIRPNCDDPAVSPDVLAAFLNSAAADSVFRCLNGSVAVSAYELQALPLPDPGAMCALTSLVRVEADRNAVDAACAILYGINERD